MTLHTRFQTATDRRRASIHLNECKTIWTTMNISNEPIRMLSTPFQPVHLWTNSNLISLNGKSSALVSAPNSSHSTLLISTAKTLKLSPKPKFRSHCQATSNGTIISTFRWNREEITSIVCPSRNISVWELQNWSSSTRLALVQLQSTSAPCSLTAFTSFSV